MKADLIEEFCKSIEDIYSWWNRLLETDGNIYPEIDNANNIVKETDFCIILATRLLWFFSSYAQYSNNTVSIKHANQAQEFLLKYFYDNENGGFIWSISSDKQFKSTKKQAYAQAFAVYALIEHYKLTKNKLSLEIAFATFEIIETHFKEKEFGGYIEALSKEFKIIEDIRLSDKDLNSAKSMNTHLHILEAYTSLYIIMPSEQTELALEDCLNIFLNLIYDEDSQHLKLFFANDWTPESDNISFGHEIETAWLLYEAALALKNDDYIKYAKEITIILGDNTLKHGVSSDGAVYYESDGNLEHIDKNGEWWGQFESIMGFYFTYKFTNDEKYLNIIYKIWEYTKKEYGQNGFGEFTWYAKNSGKQNQYLAGDWKCPYHNGRALLEIIKREKTKG